jgi:hypothetical protein
MIMAGSIDLLSVFTSLPFDFARKEEKEDAGNYGIDDMEEKVKGKEIEELSPVKPFKQSP